MKEEEITKRIRKYNLAKMFGALDEEYPIVGHIRDFPGLKKLLSLFPLSPLEEDRGNKHE